MELCEPGSVQRRSPIKAKRSVGMEWMGIGLIAWVKSCGASNTVRSLNRVAARKSAINEHKEKSRSPNRATDSRFHWQPLAG